MALTSKMVVHCSDSPQGRGDDVDTIRRWHKERGFNDVGYNFVILEDGTVQPGRPLTVKYGAHCKGKNDWMGVCLIGRDSFTDEQFEALDALITKYGCKEVKGHYAFSSKTCPNFNVEEFMDKRGEITPSLLDRLLALF